VLAAGLAAWSLSASFAQAQTNKGLSFHVAGPFSTRAMAGAWAQRVARVENPTGKEKLVQVEYVTQTEGQGKVSFFRIFSIPPMSARRAEMVIRPEVIKQAARRTAPPPGEDAAVKRTTRYEQSFILWDVGTGERVDEKFGLGMKIDPASTRLSTFDTVHYKYDTSSFLGKMAGSPLGKVVRLSARGVDLPTRWYGYSALDIALVGGVDLSRLGPGRIEALLDWVHCGGTLVMTGSVATRRMLQEELADVVGVAALELHYVSRLTVSGFVKPSTGEAQDDVTVALAWPQPMVELTPLSAKVLLTANGLPLLTKHRYGLGKAFVLATSLGAVRDPALHRIWRLVAQAVRTRPAVDRGKFPAPAREALEKIAGRRGPHQAVPVGMLVVMAAAVGLGGALLRLRRRGELLWLLLAPAGLVIAGVLYGAGLAQSDEERLTHVGLITGLGDGLAEYQAMFAYYSGPHEQEITISSGGPKGLIADVGGAAAGAISTRRVRFDNAVFLPDQVVATNSQMLLQASSIAETGGILFDLSFDESGLAGAIDNRLGFDISGAVICTNQRTYRVGDISADGPAAVKITRDDDLGLVEFVDSRGARPRSGGKGRAWRSGKGEFSAAIAPGTVDALRNQLVSGMLTVPGRTRADRRPVLIGYTRHCPIDPLAGRRLRRQGWSVVIWPVKYARSRAGAAVRIPAGFVDVQFRRVAGRAPMWNRRGRMFSPVMRNAGMQVAARAPDVVGLLAKAVATIEIDLRAPGFRLSVFGRSPGKTDPAPIDSFDSPMGRKTVTVTGANRFRGADGSYRFLIHVEKLSATPGAARVARSTTVGVVYSVTVELEGISQ